MCQGRHETIILVVQERVPCPSSRTESIGRDDNRRQASCADMRILSEDAMKISEAMSRVQQYSAMDEKRFIVYVVIGYVVIFIFVMFLLGLFISWKGNGT
jgi:hypothetical protein